MSSSSPYLPQNLHQCIISESKTLGKNSLIYTQGEKPKEFYFFKTRACWALS